MKRARRITLGHLPYISDPQSSESGKSVLISGKKNQDYLNLFPICKALAWFNQTLLELNI